MDADAAQAVLMYFVLPLWLAAGFADYLCHRAAHIETTSGWKESLLHLLQLVEMAVPTLAAIFLEINALIFLIMIVALILHHATAIWDVSYAYHTRVVNPTEQHIHSFLEILPLTGFLIVAILRSFRCLALDQCRLNSRRMKTVERIIGHKAGTGGSSGVGFLKSALE